MNKILCIGEALIDMICTDKGRSLSDGDHFIKKAGGAPTNVAAAIAALGGAVELAAKVGVDPFGNHLVQTMEEFGVGTQWIFRDPSFFTTFAFVSLMENGERDFYFNRGADGQLSSAELDNIPMNEFSIVHFGSATGFLSGPLQQAYKDLQTKTLGNNLFLSFDPNYRNLLFGNDKEHFVRQSWDFILSSHFFKVSDEEAMLITGENSVDAAANNFLQRTKGVFTITLGKEGTLLGLGGKTILIPSMPVKSIDTTGAGDAFVGAVLYQLQKKFKDHSTLAISDLDVSIWKEIISNANKAGARTCEYLGAMEAFRHLSSDIFN